jgi:hypothetical protein
MARMRNRLCQIRLWGDGHIYGVKRYGIEFTSISGGSDTFDDLLLLIAATF